MAPKLMDGRDSNLAVGPREVRPEGAAMTMNETALCHRVQTLFFTFGGATLVGHGSRCADRFSAQTALCALRDLRGKPSPYSRHPLHLRTQRDGLVHELHCDHDA